MNTPPRLKLQYHQSNDSRGIVTDDVRLSSRNTPGVSAGDVIEVYHPGDAHHALFLVSALREDIQWRDTISIEQSLANILKLQAHKNVCIRIVEKKVRSLHFGPATDSMVRPRIKNPAAPATKACAVHCSRIGMEDVPWSVLIQNERLSWDEWKRVLTQLKLEFKMFQQELTAYLQSRYPMHDGCIASSVHVSSAFDGNFMETLNMSLNLYAGYNVDRNFDRTGKSSIVISPGNGSHRVTPCVSSPCCGLDFAANIASGQQSPVQFQLRSCSTAVARRKPPVYKIIYPQSTVNLMPSLKPPPSENAHFLSGRFTSSPETNESSKCLQSCADQNLFPSTTDHVLTAITTASAVARAVQNANRRPSRCSESDSSSVGDFDWERGLESLAPDSRCSAHRGSLSVEKSLIKSSTQPMIVKGQNTRHLSVVASLPSVREHQSELIRSGQLDRVCFMQAVHRNVVDSEARKKSLSTDADGSVSASSSVDSLITPGSAEFRPPGTTRHTRFSKTYSLTVQRPSSYVGSSSDQASKTPALPGLHTQLTPSAPSYRRKSSSRPIRTGLRWSNTFGSGVRVSSTLFPVPVSNNPFEAAGNPLSPTGTAGKRRWVLVRPPDEFGNPIPPHHIHLSVRSWDFPNPREAIESCSQVWAAYFNFLRERLGHSAPGGPLPSMDHMDSRTIAARSSDHTGRSLKLRLSLCSGNEKSEIPVFKEPYHFIIPRLAAKFLDVVCRYSVSQKEETWLKGQSLLDETSSFGPNQWKSLFNPIQQCSVQNDPPHCSGGLLGQSCQVTGGSALKCLIDTVRNARNSTSHPPLFLPSEDRAQSHTRGELATKIVHSVIAFHYVEKRAETHRVQRSASATEWFEFLVTVCLFYAFQASCWLISGTDWKSLSTPALLPIATDYFPDNSSLKTEGYTLHDYRVVPVGVSAQEWESTHEYVSDRTHSFVHPLTFKREPGLSYCRRPMTVREVFYEMVLQRLGHGFQIYEESLAPSAPPVSSTVGSPGSPLSGTVTGVSPPSLLRSSASKPATTRCEQLSNRSISGSSSLSRKHGVSLGQGRLANRHRNAPEAPSIGVSPPTTQPTQTCTTIAVRTLGIGLTLSSTGSSVRASSKHLARPGRAGCRTPFLTQPLLDKLMPAHKVSAPVLLLFTIHSDFSASVSHPNCLLGCSCSNDNGAAVCCLLPADGTPEPMRFQADLCYVNESTDLNTRWPSINSCLPSWRQLQVRLTRASWPNIRPVASHPSSSCTERLERLVLVGTSASDDGLFNLQSVTLRNLFFQKLGVLQLERLTVHQTQLRKIEDGFIDQLRAVRLRDVEISRNPNLTSVGLGVGWLAYAPHLRLLDLSRNKLTVVELAKWGFPPEGNTALATLLLSGNQIAYLKPKTFERASNLIKLDLSDNLLSSVSLDVFSGLESLKILNLRGNRLTLPGLNLGSVTLLNTLPNLVHLQLSANPLLTTNSTFPHWWLTGPCPRQLTKISLDELTSGQPVLPDKLLTLPPISWDQCPSLTELALPRLPMIPCLPQSWLGLAPEVQTIPERFRIRPASLQLCPPSTALPEAIASVQRSQPSSPLTPYPLSAGAVIFIEPTTLSSMHGGNGKTHSEPWSEDADTVHYSRTLHILRLRGAGISPWILFVVLFVLFFAVVSLTAEWAI
ncbi:leucine Rich repeat-containing domain protein [Opisthorchis viverrini]|uniref:Leucine Rich repeat-containing domain protein n=1 Tax=Opisthorchis viverrini TaxID=6198 RepID=A0A1S8X6I4_OPIVI|nr:leucine Rich repeat-containing domain protein [Opisthorchis viverrini]